MSVCLEQPVSHLSPNHARSDRASASYRRILGINFFIGNARQAVKAGMRGGLVVAPAAPSLLDLNRDSHYRDALLESDLAITDSGFMVLVWNALVPDRICRVSGLEYLKLLLSEPEFRKAGATFWVMPSAVSLQRNLYWLSQRGVRVEDEDCYIAPKYSGGAICDEKLLDIINVRRPSHVVLAIGGGTQERLGLYLKRHCDFQPGIHCTGAAIAFLSGDQTRIPDWADRHKLGWLVRCLSNPKRYLPRYAKAFRLALLLWRHRDQLPT